MPIERTRLTRRQHLSSPLNERHETSRNRRPKRRPGRSISQTNRLPSRRIRPVDPNHGRHQATGSPAAGIRHALLCCEHKKHIVMINVEADVLAGPLLARKAVEAGIIYSMVYGDQPALIAEMVDWARTAGFDVVCAGNGTKHLPAYHQSTPDTVWDHHGFTREQLATGEFNPQMFNSFLDGTKSALEMAAVANACDLTPPSNGLLFPPCSRNDLPHVLRPKADGGMLERKGTCRSRLLSRNRLSTRAQRSPFRRLRDH